MIGSAGTGQTQRGQFGRKVFVCLAAMMLLAGCTAKHYRKAADKETYKIIQEKQKKALGKTNEFSIDTPYSQRKPDELKSKELIDDRLREAKQVVTLTEALKLAVQS